MMLITLDLFFFQCSLLFFISFSSLSSLFMIASHSLITPTMASNLDSFLDLSEFHMYLSSSFSSSVTSVSLINSQFVHLLLIDEDKR